MYNPEETFSGICKIRPSREVLLNEKICLVRPFPSVPINRFILWDLVYGFPNFLRLICSINIMKIRRIIATVFQNYILIFISLNKLSK